VETDLRPYCGYVKYNKANETVMNVVCPPGTFALAIAVAITVPPCMFWLFWTLYG
jgi:hypothetical protein